MDSGVTDTNRLRGNLSALSVVTLFGSLILFIVWFQKYLDDKVEYTELCVQKYIDSNFKQIPDKQSVVDFVDGGK